MLKWTFWDYYSILSDCLCLGFGKPKRNWKHTKGNIYWDLDGKTPTSYCWFQQYPTAKNCVGLTILQKWCFLPWHFCKNIQFLPWHFCDSKEYITFAANYQLNSSCKKKSIFLERSTVPIEVKLGTQGAMQSLRWFMAEKNIDKGIRTSLENFVHYENIDVIPMYAISNLFRP